MFSTLSTLFSVFGEKKFIFISIIGFLGLALAYLYINNHALESEIAEKTLEISVWKYSAQKNEATIKSLVEHQEKLDLIISEIEVEKTVLIRQSNQLKKELQEKIQNDAEVQKWSNEPVPLQIQDLLVRVPS